MSATNETELVTVEAWVLVDADGEYEVAKGAADLQAGPGLASRMVKLTVQVPKPRTIELAATIAAEPATGELRAA
jgi:hypothetical protein